MFNPKMLMLPTSHLPLAIHYSLQNHLSLKFP